MDKAMAHSVNAADPFGLVARMAKGETVSFEKVAPPEKTKIQVLIEYLEEHGKATTEEVCKVLGIEGRRANGKKRHPMNYLSVPVRDGRIKRIGQMWSAGKAAAPKKPAAVARKVPSTPKIPYVVAAKPAVLSPQAAPEVSPVAPVMAPEVQTKVLDNGPDPKPGRQFACALWSNGELQIMRDGGILAMLRPEEVAPLRSYLSRMPANT